MKPAFPRAFVERLKEIYPLDFEEVLGQLTAKPVVVRMSELGFIGLKGLVGLKKNGGFEGVYEVSGMSSGELTKLDAYRRGEFYIQSLSSICIPLVLDPRPGERVLDLCAAPGSKTSQMCVMMRGAGDRCVLDSTADEGFLHRERDFHSDPSTSPLSADPSALLRMTKLPLVAVELDRERCRRLREVLELQGVSDMVEVIRGSGTHLGVEYEGVFDKVLVDAPCSADARFDIDKPRTFNHWGKHRIKGYALKQKKLIMSGLRYLKHGGTLVYSTCSMNPEENEGIVDYALRTMGRIRSGGWIEESCPQERISNFQFPISNEGSKSNVQFSALGVLDVDLPIGRIDPIMEWHGRVFDPAVVRTFRMKPNRLVQPFFLAKLRKW